MKEKTSIDQDIKININIPTTQEEQIIKMAESGRVNRNWLEMVAYNTGVDCDHIKGVDDDFCDRTHKSEIINNQ